MKKFGEAVFSLGVSDSNPELGRAQLKAFARHIPYMYAIVGISTGALVFEHYAYAPAFLTTIVPAVLIALVVMRIVHYLRLKPDTLSDEAVNKRLRSVVVLAAVLGLAFAIWALSLYPYGDVYTQSHVILYTGLTSFGIMVCLLHLKASAFVLGLSTLGPLAGVLIMSGNSVFTITGVNIILVGLLFSIVLHDNAKDFARMISQEKVLRKRQKEAQKLSDANLVLANSDSLTGLANRRKFFSALGERLAEPEAAQSGLAVGVFDLDGFKPVNDVYGHRAGDEVLIEIGKRLEAAGDDIFVARLGGDEFGLIFSTQMSDADLLLNANALCEKIGHSVCGKGFQVRMTASVGLARYVGGITSPEQLYEQADYALYYAKEQHKGQSVLFSDEHKEQVQRRALVERLLLEPKLADELHVAFQFVRDIRTGQFTGAEALARWNSPELGPVSPDEFIGAAERIGLVSRLTEILLTKTLDAVQDWPENLKVSFNLSANDIASKSFVEHLVGLIESHRVSTDRLTLEITETALVRDFDHAKDCLHYLRSKGIRIALDDFGVGYSSLTYLRQLPLDCLKVDRSFITDVGQDPRSDAIVSAVLDCSRTLGLEIVAEGVETETQLNGLQRLGCHLVQGYLFSKPIAGEEAQAFADAQASVPLGAHERAAG